MRSKPSSTRFFLYNACPTKEQASGGRKVLVRLGPSCHRLRPAMMTVSSRNRPYASIWCWPMNRWPRLTELVRERTSVMTGLGLQGFLLVQVEDETLVTGFAAGQRLHQPLP